MGRTRLQKIAYLLELVGLGEGFSFAYHHYGPYSEDLNLAVQLGVLFDALHEQERPANWGGRYSIFTTNRSGDEIATLERKRFARLAAEADPVELELAATAAFLVTEGVSRAWEETAKRKPEKSKNGRIAKAKTLYKKLSELNVPRRLPNLA